MCFLTEALPTCPTFTHFHLGNHFLWATRKLAIWSPDTASLGTLLCWLFCTNTLLFLALNFCFRCSLCLGRPFLHTSVPQHSGQTQSERLSPTRGLEESFQEEITSELNVPHLSSLTSEETCTSL